MPPHSTSTRSSEQVLRALLARIVSGKLPPGAELPTADALAELLEADPEAVSASLERLREWRVVDAALQRLRPAGDWSVRVLTQLADAREPGVLPPVATLAHEMVQLTRAVTMSVTRSASLRLARGQLDEARACMEEAWRHREQPLAFAAHHYRMNRALLESASLYATLWLLNELAEVHLALFGGRGIRVPDDYHDTHLRYFDALERGDEGDALAVMADYMDRYEQKVVASLRSRNG